jgi:PKD repeat protein
MGLGENIGYSTRISQNNSTTYFPSYGARFTHIALMGDPTLRQDIVAPVSNVVASQQGEGTFISWSFSPDSILGYHVYVKTESMTSYMRLNDTVVTDTVFESPCIDESGIHTYMVRALKLQHTPSGTYFNLSTGITDTAMVTMSPVVTALATWETFGNEVTFTNQSLNAISYEWHFGDGETSTEVNPTHLYADGEFIATLIARNRCGADTLVFQIMITTGMNPLQDDDLLIVTPNLTAGKFRMLSRTQNENLFAVKIYNATGQLIFSKDDVLFGQVLDLSDMAMGVYLIHVQVDGIQRIKRIVIQK